MIGGGDSGGMIGGGGGGGTNGGGDTGGTTTTGGATGGTTTTGGGTPHTGGKNADAVGVQSANGNVLSVTVTAGSSFLSFLFNRLRRIVMAPSVAWVTRLPGLCHL